MLPSWPRVKTMSSISVGMWSLAHRADIRENLKLDKGSRNQAERIKDMAWLVTKTTSEITNLETGNTRRCEAKTHRVFKVFTANAIAKQKVD